MACFFREIKNAAGARLEPLKPDQSEVWFFSFEAYEAMICASEANDLAPPRLPPRFGEHDEPAAEWIAHAHLRHFCGFPGDPEITRFTPAL
jgi:hypothetical protein